MDDKQPIDEHTKMVTSIVFDDPIAAKTPTSPVPNKPFGESTLLMISSWQKSIDNVVTSSIYESPTAMKAPISIQMDRSLKEFLAPIIKGVINGELTKREAYHQIKKTIVTCKRKEELNDIAQSLGDYGYANFINKTIKRRFCFLNGYKAPQVYKIGKINDKKKKIPCWNYQLYHTQLKQTYTTQWWFTICCLLQTKEMELFNNATNIDSYDGNYDPYVRKCLPYFIAVIAPFVGIPLLFWMRNKKFTKIEKGLWIAIFLLTITLTGSLPVIAIRCPKIQSKILSDEKIAVFIKTFSNKLIGFFMMSTLSASFITVIVVLLYYLIPQLYHCTQTTNEKVDNIDRENRMQIINN
jgi:hypothetical protein